MQGAGVLGVTTWVILRSPMKTALLEYLATDRMLGLAVGLVGLVSVAVGVYCLAAQRPLKVFAWTMLVLGVLECGFLVSYWKGPEPANNPDILAYDANPEAVTAKQAEAIERAVAAVFWVKLAYALVILGGVVSLSKLDPGPTVQGVLIALVLHASCAITIDNFVERNGKATLKALRGAPASSSS